MHEQPRYGCMYRGTCLDLKTVQGQRIQICSCDGGNCEDNIFWDLTLFSLVNHYNVSESFAACIFRVEVEDSWFLRNDDNDLPGYTASLPIKH